MRQVLTAQENLALDIWARLMGSHAAMTRAFNAALQREHGLTVSDFEVLRRLSLAAEGQMRRVDLAGEIGLTASGMTRLLDGLQRAGLVERRQCAEDARVTYAAISASGRERLRRAAGAHVSALGAIFAERFSDAEMETLGALLARLPGAAAADGACGTEA